MSDQDTSTTPTEPDPDGDPGQLNPRDLTDVPSEDTVAADGAGDAVADSDGDPEQLNPRG